MTKLDSHETKTAFAARVGLTKGRISQLVAEGLPVRADGQIDVAVGLAWIEDDSNTDERFDRNYLRRQVVPLLKARWSAAARVATSAGVRSGRGTASRAVRRNVTSSSSASGFA